ncbi:hypothetical protein HGRIS_004553 [Hohenbuehelia grisea]|uniref:Ubiquitin-like protease family profile domain-containing protein n=1 Tax=Hohenbuehelia grisea TaxID=104357 RepID=A0ABR3JCD6_9AGAR
MMLTRIRHLPIPSTATIHSLVEAARQACLAGSKSLVYAHVTQTEALTRVPFWIVTFWNEVLKLRASRGHWVKARDWLNGQARNRKLPAARHELAKSAMTMLSLLPWGRQKVGLSDSKLISVDLWRLLGTHWLSSTNQDDMLELLHNHISHSASRMFILQGVDFTTKLYQAYTTRQAGEYQSRRDLAWLCNVGEGLAESEGVLLTTVNLRPYTGSEHWVAMTVDAQAAVVRYGDGLEVAMPAELREAYRWWLAQHTVRYFEFTNLPIARQTDAHSCGILADNALSHHLDPSRFPLVEPSGAVDARLQQFLHLSRYLLERLDLAASSASVASPPSTPVLAMSVDTVDPDDSMPKLIAENVEAEEDDDDDDDWEMDGTAAPESSASVLLTESVPENPCRESEKIRAEMEVWQHDNAQAQRMKKARERVQNRERQQQFQERRRNQQKADGWEPGEKRKRSLKDYDNDADDRPAVAELSRPHRQYKEDTCIATKKATGRKRKPENKPKESKLTNWFTPFLFSQIEIAASRAGKPWSPRMIVKEAKALNPKDFARLTEQVVGRWIDPEAKKRGESKWKDKIMEQVSTGSGNRPGGGSTRTGILAAYPMLQAKIHSHIEALREGGAVLTMLTIHAIMIAFIEADAPHLFRQPIAKDGSRFKCSEAFVRKYLHRLGWSERCATRAAQKLPANHEQILTEAYIREARVIRDHRIPAELRVNTDQTQSVYSPGTKSTWTKAGVKQVATKGFNDKRTFTLVPSISASGELLPMQAIYSGQSTQSLPARDAARYTEALKLGVRFTSSMTKTYWSTLATMKALVNDIIAPYFDHKKAQMKFPSTQCSI